VPVLKSRTALEMVRGIKAFLRIEGGFTRGAIPDPELTVRVQARRLGEAEARIAQQRLALEDRERRITRLSAELADKAAKPVDGGLRPENIVWIFGHGRTGSTWLSAMMGDVGDHAVWFEPCVGELFGDFYYVRARAAQRASASFVLGDRQRGTWIKSMRSFVLDGARGRFPKMGERGYLVIKEPHGSVGAPLIAEALPESRMVLLIRDPRDAVSSSLEAFKKGNWAYEQTYEDGIAEVALATDQPDAFVKMKAEDFLLHVGKAKEAYESHTGPKVLVRYEELRADTLGTMRHIYSTLGIAVDEKELAGAVEKHSWENTPTEKKGEGKFYRKATPGGWREDLTPGQVETVERITAPLLKAFYP